MSGMAGVRGRSYLHWPAQVLAVLVLTAGTWVWANPPIAAKKPPAAACGDYGTAIEFEPTPKDAARRAATEEKLVMVLHVSGHFEDPGLT